LNVKVDDSKSLFTYLLVLIIISVINTFLAHFGELPYRVVPGGPGLYFAAAFMIVFTLWFGGWGVIAAYIGCYIGAGMFAGIPYKVNLYWSLADVWQVLIPLIAFKKLKADINLKTKRDFVIFLAFGLILNNIAGAVWGATTLAIGGVTSWNNVPPIFLDWFTGNLIVTILITPLLLRYATRYIQKVGLYVVKYWS